MNSSPDAEPIVTIVVVPRERFSVSLRSLTTLMGNTDYRFNLVYVDGNSPRAVHDRLREEAGRYGFTLVRTEHYLSPNQARNLGLQHVSTPYAVFVDNDVIVTPGWLAPLVDCAEETGAWVVGPLAFEGQLANAQIHDAGGFLRFQGPEGDRDLVQDSPYQHQHRSELPDDLRRLKVDFVEFHCVLVRRAAFDAIGPLDEELLSSREHLDLCLQVQGAGGEVWSELTSLVTYDHPPPVTWSDLPYFMLRWSEEWNRASVRHFIDKYRLSEDYLRNTGGPRARRHVAFKPIKTWVSRTLGDRTVKILRRALVTGEPRLNSALMTRRARTLADSSRH